MENSIKSSQIEIEQRDFIINVYKWMSLGLFLTAAIAYIVSSSLGLVNLIIGNKLVFYGLLISEVLMVFYFASAVKNISAFQAMIIFLAYATMNGLTLSIIFIIYTTASIAVTFLITAGVFGIMSIYGYFTKTDLTSIGNLCIMALLGLIIASLANIFFFNETVYWITTYAGIVIFVGLTAYDTQKIKKLNIIGNAGTDEDVKESINGALILYLDFINLFLHLLRILGKRR